MIRHLVLVGATAYVDPTSGLTVPAGAAVNRVLWDGIADYVPFPGAVLLVDDGRVLWAPPAQVPTTIGAYDFINRLTPAEQSAIQAAAPLWAIKMAARGTIDVTDAKLLAEVRAAVTAGLLTLARATQILNLAVASP